MLRKAVITLTVVLLSVSGTARAQSQAVLDDLKRLKDSLTKPGITLGPDDAQRAEQRLAEWKLEADKLKPEPRASLLTVETLAALGRGNAALAREKFAALETAAPGTPGTLVIGYFVACIAGDGALGERVLKAAAGSAPADQKELIARRRRWVGSLGKKAPDAMIRTDDGTEIGVLQRGDKVLVIDFWNSQTPAPAESMAALKQLFAAMRLERNFEMVGVNAESQTRTQKAMDFAKQNGLEWKIRYEEQTGKAPLTNEAFHAGSPPWTVVVDTFGFIRGVGDPADPGFAYSLRAALAEAHGQFEPLLKGGAKGGGESTASSKGKDQPAQTGELPSNPEARAKLEQARAFWMGGKKTDARKLAHEVVDGFPGTREAKEAAEYLVNWENQP